MKPILFSLIFSIIFVPPLLSIECYSGLRVLQGMSIGTSTIRCDNSASYCYNMSATTSTIIDVTKAGCSMWRCMFAQNKCISTVFQKIPISLCCCNTPLCNVGEKSSNTISGPQRTGGWNAQPENNENSRSDLTQDEIRQRFDSAELDDDKDVHSSRASRFATSPEPEFQQNENLTISTFSEEINQTEIDTGNL